MIHMYHFNDNNIVLDVNSGVVHVVDDVAYDILGELKDEVPKEMSKEILERLKDVYSEDAIKNAYSELFDLYSSGELFSKDVYKPLAKKMQDAPIKSMCLNVAHDCNLRCEYCFAAKGDFGCGRMLMSSDVGKRAIDFLIKNSGTRKNLELDFFGGEPLMNFDVVKEVVSYAREEEKKYNKNFRFTITTNGLLLDDEKINFINEEMSNVVLSLDGRKQVNDRMRVTPNGKGCYDVIVPKFQKLVQQRKNKDYYLRGTFTKYNLDFINDVLKMYELGFKNLSIEPVMSDSRLSYSIKEEDVPAVLSEYEKLANLIVDYKSQNKDFNFFHFMIDLDAGPCVIKKLRGCSCGNEYVAVTPQGDIYPCHQFVGEEKWRMGNVVDGTFDLSVKDLFSKINVYKKDKCTNCWAKFYCSGGCNANNWQYKNDLLTPHDISCEFEKKRIECAIGIAVRIDSSC